MSKRECIETLNDEYNKENLFINKKRQGSSKVTKLLKRKY